MFLQLALVIVGKQVWENHGGLGEPEIELLSIWKRSGIGKFGSILYPLGATIKTHVIQRIILK